MQQRLRLRRPRSWLVLLCAAVGLGLLAAPTASAITSAQCDARVNDTPSKLVECIQTADLWDHMKAFQEIADQNPGPDGHASRNSGEPGYKASADYVASNDGASRIRRHNPEVQVPVLRVHRDSVVQRSLADAAGPTRSTSTGVRGRAPGPRTLLIQPAGGIIIPPTATSSSTSGCTAADFNGSMQDRIALIQRGGCNFGVKVQNAQAAGANGVIIFNEGNPGRTDLLVGSLVDAAGNPIVPTIPVAFTTSPTA